MATAGQDGDHGRNGLQPPYLAQLSRRSGFDEWRIRSAPSTKASELGAIKAGDVVQVVERLGDWLKVEVDGGRLEGWALGVFNGHETFVSSPGVGESWAVLVVGGTRAAHYGTPTRPWMDLGGEVALFHTLGHIYAQMAAELGSERVIVIAGLKTMREWLRGMASKGYSEPTELKHQETSKRYYGNLDASRAKWQKRKGEMEIACASLIADGGADYDGVEVNPTTVLQVLSGTSSCGGRVLPARGVGSVFFWVTTHGSAHPISVGAEITSAGGMVPLPIADEAQSMQSVSLDTNEWFWIMPHQATDTRPYGFVRAAGYTIDPRADQSADHSHLPLFCVYWQHIFAVLHKTQAEDPGRKVVAFYQFCLAGGHLSFLQRPAIRQHWGIDEWPIYMVASAAANQNSLGATLTLIFLELLRIYLVQDSTMPLGLFFCELQKTYWARHARLEASNRRLPPSMRIGEVEHFHTPGGGIQCAPLSAVFSNARGGGAAEVVRGRCRRCPCELCLAQPHLRAPRCSCERCRLGMLAAEPPVLRCRQCPCAHCCKGNVPKAAGTPRAPPLPSEWQPSTEPSAAAADALRQPHSEARVARVAASTMIREVEPSMDLAISEQLARSELIDTIVGMGFARLDVVQALDDAKGHADLAVERLLCGGGRSTSARSC
eukprot:TRINITY_DN49667_c0_g1_i1.p1 TRINITY_DN49667_c0_g1~~TRINITY_DN49667_c0_g1_i1.p1  ORF type:complete len:681 (+),score=91.27 TRINITY_DN49667_c0_g1_i1:62-2044(+)